MSDEILVLSHPARVRFVTVERERQLLTLAQTRGYLDDAILASYTPFYFSAEISNTLLDSHFTHMAESSLKNYATGASEGVAFLKGHNWRELPLGYSLEGRLEEVSGKKRVVADFYSVEGLPETNDLIARMKTGLVRDVSVGIHGGQYICDICGNDFWDCFHFPGIKYEVKKGDTVSYVLATYTVEDAELSEVSGVFDGSTPDAMIFKAQRMAEDGRITREQVQILEQQYRVKLPYKRTIGGNLSPIPVQGYEWRITEKGERLERIEEGKMDLEKLLEQVRIHLKLEEDESVFDGINRLEQRIKELEPQAKDGVQYRTDLIAGAVAEGIRALGNDFDKDGYSLILQSAPLDTIKRMTADWKKVADSVLPKGRISVDDDQTPVKEESKRRVDVPDEAYA